MGSGTFRSFDLNLQRGPGKLEVGQGQTAKIDEKRSLFAPKYVIFVSCKFANYFFGIEKFPVNRKTAENNTLSQKSWNISQNYQKILDTFIMKLSAISELYKILKTGFRLSNYYCIDSVNTI